MSVIKNIPDGFTCLDFVDPTIIQDIRYSGNDNFIGRPFKGYERNTCVVSIDVAEALLKVQQTLKSKNLSLKVYEAYRPLRASQDIINWSLDINDQKMKKRFYPDINKSDFFDLGYVAMRSAHTRGAAVDVTLVSLDSKSSLDMGTIFDYLGELSHTDNKNINKNAQNNRMLLKYIMEENGFQNYEKEWWHFSLKKEPFSDLYFDFPII